MILNIPVRRNRNEPFHLNSDRNFRNLWHNGAPQDLRRSGFTAHACLGLNGVQDKVDVLAFHKGIQYALEKLGKSKFGSERTAVSNVKSKRHEGSWNEIVDYSRAPCLGADQKTRGLWERDCIRSSPRFQIIFSLPSADQYDRRLGVSPRSV